MRDLSSHTEESSSGPDDDAPARPIKSRLSELPTVEAEIPDRALWKGGLNGPGGEIEIKLSAAGTLSVGFPDESASATRDEPPRADANHQPEAGDISEAGASNGASDGPDVKESSSGTISADLSVEYVAPATLRLTATVPISRSLETELGTCEVEGTPCLELEMTAKPRRALDDKSVPKNTAEFLDRYESLLTSVRGRIRLSPAADRTSFLTRAAFALLLLGAVALGWVLHRPGHPPTTIATSTTTSTGGVLGPRIALPTRLDCGSVVVGGLLSCPGLRISSVGDKPLVVTRIEPTPDFQVGIGTCGRPLPPGAGCELDVAFDPKNVGPTTEALTIHQNLSGLPSHVTLTGIAVVPPAFTSNDSQEFFRGKSNTFTITTTGSPTAALTETGQLPEGVTFEAHSDGTATISGTPADDSWKDSPYRVNIHADNGASTDQSFTLTVDSPIG
jgi:hypothetical protein